MADGGSDARLRAVLELLFLHRLPVVPRSLLAALVVVACCALGASALDVQEHFAAQPGGGRLADALAQGSTGATAWTGWAAAAFFLVALVRLRHGAPEPPAGRTPVEALTPGQLRAGLVREYTVVRCGLVVLALIALVDAARAGRYVVAAAGGTVLARGSVVATVIEAAGLVAAAAVLTLWGLAFRSQLVRVGAVVEPAQSAPPSP